MSRELIEQVAEALAGFLPPALRGYASHRSGRLLKVWYDDPREHYEVQLIRQGARLVLEVGFHAEHPSAGRNDEVLSRLSRAERAWRRALGRAPESGRFIGRLGDTWRRVSEVWDGPGLDDPATAVEAAHRLAAYIRALEPLRLPPGGGQPGSPRPRPGSPLGRGPSG